MKKAQLKGYEELLRNKIDALIGKAGETLGGMVADTVTNFPDPNDQATMETDRNFLLRVRDRERKLILKARQALKRIEDGTYGFCDYCGDRIKDNRLQARPEATLCIECKKELELREKRSKL